MLTAGNELAERVLLRQWDRLDAGVPLVLTSIRVMAGYVRALLCPFV